MSFTIWRKGQVPGNATNCRFRRADGVLVTRQGGELVLLDTRRERYYTLNDVGAVVWGALAESSTRAALLQAIVSACDASALPDVAVVEGDVARLLEQFLAAGLVSVESGHGEAAP
jgi:hypothetical protein